MTKVRDIITDAHIEINAYAVGDALPAEAAEYALRLFNRMIERWNNAPGMIYTVNRNEYTLTPSKQSYTIGTGGDIPLSRPVKIPMVSVIPVSGTPEIPVNILTDEEWRSIAVKDTQSAFPTQIWFTGNVPYNTAYMWPVPTTACKIVLYSWGKAEAFTSLDDVVIFPQGYEEMFVTNLAIALCSSFGKQPDMALVQRAQVSSALIASQNVDPAYIGVDCALIGRGASKAIQSFGLVVD